LDFVLQFDATAFPPELVRLTRFGIWSYDFDREALPCFGEVVAGSDRTEARLERLAETGKPDAILFRGWFGTCKASWVNNFDRVASGAAEFAARVCNQFALGIRTAPNEQLAEARVEQADPFSFARPGMRDAMARMSTHALGKLWELLFHLEIWNVGFCARTVAEIVRRGALGPEPIRWCSPHTPGHLIADPFAFERDGIEHLLVEEYPQGGKGTICRVVNSAGAGLELQTELEEPFHLSYPYVFESEGELYCVPESYQARAVRLYRRLGNHWQYEADLLTGVPLVDPTLFEHDGLYWILGSRQDDGAWGNLNLYAFYAHSLRGPYQPHPLNPVKCDIGSSRPAGRPILVDGQLFRPAQDCSRTYGGALVLNRIVKLSPTEYEELPQVRLEPRSNWPYASGLHTLNATRSGSVIDAKAFVFDVFAWRKNWTRLHEVLR
jgi:hypothetical protein